MSRLEKPNSFDQLSLEDRDRLIRMGWEDRTAFEAIEFQFGFTQNQFIKFMRSELSPGVFRRWRKRNAQVSHLKNENKSGITDKHFKCTRQSVDGITKGWK